MELTFDSIQTSEFQQECWRLARLACMGKYRTNRQPQIACMTDDDPLIRIGGALWSATLLEDKQVDKDSQLLGLKAALRFEKHPLVRMVFEITIEQTGNS